MKIVTENGRRVLAFSDKPGFRFSVSMGPYVVIYDGKEPQGALQENYIFTSTFLIVRIFPRMGSEFAATTGVVSPGSVALADPRFVMLYIVIGRLYALCMGMKIDRKELETRVNQTIKIPTIEQAVKWLEQNRFTGPDAYSVDGRPGWIIAAHPTRRLVGLPPKEQELHDDIWGAVIDKFVARYPNIKRNTPHGEEIFQFIDSYIKEGKHKR